ncbi:hypothetical protein A2870_00350 [Candidatus Curtissbacteria bacterium RIFCSPHIGHO2_01_FULL_41_11]|uniref:Uncharacterized protein n=1 Tax=Candidatus Curtissbacteria bacterium RIFCSPHIGHO2_01_FULL_41_11 TaxID=1797711 RepID=A0A1F5G4Y5_9BACT|nr:MAG: hypothetical protein A2870_00350 [Candidatus Curtissbacteria bacterium RIFCSPHIGHO2_01_FULL_41_11]
MVERTEHDVPEHVWKEAERLDRHPAVQATLDQAQQTLESVFGIGTGQINLKTSVRFLPKKNVEDTYYHDLRSNEVIFHGFAQRRITPKPEAFHYPTGIEAGDGAILMVAEDFSDFFPEAMDKERSQLIASAGSVTLFRTLMNIVPDSLTSEKQVKANNSALRKMCEQLVEDIPNTAAVHLDPEVIKFANEMRDTIEKEEGLDIICRGVVSTVRIDGKNAVYIFEDHHDAVKQMLYEHAQGNFVKRMFKWAKFRNKRWFVLPDHWPQGWGFKVNEDRQAYVEVKGEIKKRGLESPKSLFQAFRRSELAFSFLRDFMPEITPEEISQTQDTNEKIQAEESTEKVDEKQSETLIENGELNTLAEKPATTVHDEDAVQDSTTEIIEQKRAARKDKKKKRKSGHKRPVQTQPKKRPINKQEPQVQKLIQIESSPTETVINILSSESLGRPKRVDEIIKIAIESLKEFYPDLPTLPQDSFNFIDPEEFQKIYDITHKVRNQTTPPAKLPPSFQDESIYPPQVFINAGEFADIENDDIELKTFAEWELAKTVIQNFLLHARTPRYYHYPHEPFWTEALERSIEQGIITPPQEYPVINQDNLDVAVQTYKSFLEEDETGQTVLDGAEIKFVIRINRDGNDSTDAEITRTGQALEDTLIRYMSHILVETMLDKMQEDYTEELQAEARKIYKSYLTPSTSEAVKFEDLKAFLNTLGLKSLRKIIASHSKSEIPLLYLEAKEQNPRLVYPA